MIILFYTVGLIRYLILALVDNALYVTHTQVTMLSHFQLVPAVKITKHNNSMYKRKNNILFCKEIIYPQKSQGVTPEELFKR